MEARPLPSRADEIAYINELRKAYRVDTSADIPCYTGKDLKPFRPKFVQGYPDWDAGQEVAAYDKQCLRFAADPKPEQMTAYLESGFGLTDLYCQRYFTIATETRQSRRLQRDVVKTGGTLVNAVLTALSAGSNPIGITSSGFSAIDAGYGAVDDAFVVAPTRDDVRKLVLGAQQQFRADVFKADNKGRVQLPKRYQSARATIERYAGLCTFDGMRQLVADAVKEKTDALNTSAQETPAKGEDKAGAKSTQSKKAPAVAKSTPATRPQSLTAPPPVSPTSSSNAQ
jgi:hypothetical protein